MKKRKPLSVHPVVKIVAVVLGVLVLGLIGYVAAVKPEGAKVKRIRAEEATAQAALAAYDQKVAELTQLSRDTGITFTSIQPQSPMALGGYTVLPISLTFDGNFYDLADLLYRLRSLVTVHAGRLDATGRLFSVDTLTFGEAPKGFPQITATLVVDAFVYGTNGLPVASSTTTTGSTTTGSTTTSTTTTTPTTTTPPSAAPTASASAAGAH